MTALALAQLGPVHKTPGNFNNEVGLPLTLLQTPSTAAAMVLELGMSAAGEIDRLQALCTPDVRLITNVGPAHVENFPDGIQVSWRRA